MSKQAEEKLEEWARWFDERKREVSDPVQAYKMIMKMMEGFFDILAYYARDIRDAEGRSSVKSDILWLPHGMTKFKDDKPKNPEDTELGV